MLEYIRFAARGGFPCSDNPEWRDLRRPVTGLVDRRILLSTMDIDFFPIVAYYFREKQSIQKMNIRPPQPREMKNRR